ncbi:hypothetical protein Nepgr_010148 [Nepenthes gracilis]|uniref:TOG domain-containing protein n=1 Tax=Nepenthes gracilis TaxID=150966 RepID=A0AAD3XKS5_NEPGR|nr:hypothetical protein Nepgr_010148 [Nepenthes gracilis]
MALRPIDNALPIITDRDRAKKLVKIPVRIHNKPSDLGANNENGDQLPPNADATIDYISSADLKPIKDPEGSIQLLQLLLKASQDKRFVCEEADKALKAMAWSMTPIPLLSKLKACVSHPNLKVRAKAAILISDCVSKMRAEELNEFGSVWLVQKAAELLNDRLPEAREAARSIVMTLYQSFAGGHEEEDTRKLQQQEAWQNFCQSNLPALHAQSLLKFTITQ